MRLHYINLKPLAAGLFKQKPEDFIVHEQLSFEPSGLGEHVFLQLQKRELNTIQLAEQLAKFAKVRLRDVGYAGLKDKHGITSQWFSLYLPKKPNIEWKKINSDLIKILNITQHDRKLRSGALKGNTFEITLREVKASESIAERLEQISLTGFPNYFGEQRFGRHEGNIEKAYAMLTNQLEVKNNKLRGIYYSTARSLIFNQVLSERVRQKNFNQAIDGDMLQFLGRRSYFSIDTVDEAIKARVLSHEIAPAGPLWGLGQHHASLKAAAIETKIFSELSEWISALEKHKLELGYRPYVVYPQNIELRYSDNSAVTLKFFLPRGTYATSLLRELGSFQI